MWLHSWFAYAPQNGQLKAAALREGGVKGVVGTTEIYHAGARL
jgi:hypothetical protein